jgi:hypothetical protein
MNDSFGVCGFERVGDLNAEREQSVQFHRTPGDTVLQGRAIQKLHGDERLPVLFTDVLDRAYAGMIKGRRGLRLALEPGEGMRISRYMLRQKLERDETVETSILGLVDDAHATAAEFLEDAVMRDGLADHSWQTALDEAC